MSKVKGKRLTYYDLKDYVGKTIWFETDYTNEERTVTRCGENYLLECNSIRSLLYTNSCSFIKEHNVKLYELVEAAESVEVHNEMPIEDVVNHPNHYTSGSIECIDYIKDKLGKDGFESFLQGNIIKYITRFKMKNGVEDLKKAEFYLKRLIESMS